MGEFAQRNAVVVGISLDTVESHRNFSGSEQLTFQLLSDRDGRVAAAYGSLTNLVFLKIAARRTFLIDPQGKISRSFLSVQPKDHDQEVLDALDDLSHVRA